MRLFILFFLFVVTSCGLKKYEVIEMVHPGQYHLERLDKKDVMILSTDMDLKPGQILKVKKKEKKDQ